MRDAGGAAERGALASVGLRGASRANRDQHVLYGFSPEVVRVPSNGARVAALGVGPTPIPRARLTRERLAVALRRSLEDDAMRARAAALGERIRAEDGVAEAVRRFEALAADRG